MTKGDIYTKELFKEILEEGCLDKNPRPHYEDEVLVDARTVTDLEGNIIEVKENQGLEKRGDKWYLITPAHTLSINHKMLSYDLSKGEFPIITLRPIAVKSAIGELLWIYQRESNDLEILANDYGVTWWDDWMIKEEESLKHNWPKKSIGACYGETIRRHNLMKNLLEGLKNDPDGNGVVVDPEARLEEELMVDVILLICGKKMILSFLMDLNLVHIKPYGMCVMVKMASTI